MAGATDYESHTCSNVHYEDEDSEEGPSGERWPPLGAAAADDNISLSSDPSFS